MVLRVILAVVVVFVIWSALDFVIHGVLLGPTYEATAELWRPMEEIKAKIGWMYGATAVGAVCFTTIYALLIRPGSVAKGVAYGLLFGIGTGVPMALATYSVMPIPPVLAEAWLFGAVVEAVIAGLLVGLIVGKPKEAAAAG